MPDTNNTPELPRLLEDVTPKAMEDFLTGIQHRDDLLAVVGKVIAIYGGVPGVLNGIAEQLDADGSRWQWDEVFFYRRAVRKAAAVRELAGRWYDFDSSTRLTQAEIDGSTYAHRE